MAAYVILFNDEWTPEVISDEELVERGRRGRAVIDEMRQSGAFVFSDGGLDASTAICSVEPGDEGGGPVFSDGPYVETKEHLGGFAIIDVGSDEEARSWAGKIAEAVGWPQELHRFPNRARQAEQRLRDG